MRVMPVVLCRDFLRSVITILEFLGFQKLFYGFVRAPRAQQFVAVHVVGVRNGGSETRVFGGELQGFADVPNTFAGVRIVVQSREVFWRKCQCSLIEG